MAENVDFKTAPCNVRVKEEDWDSTPRHSHDIKVKFNARDANMYRIHCSQTRTVLAALKSSNKFSELNCPDENIVIQLGTADKKNAVPTHIPCTCIPDGETLIITCESQKVEEGQDQHDKTIHSKDEYSVFYIDTVGGQNARQKKLFRNNAVKQFKYLCVYGKKGMTVEEALRRDGRFIDDLGDFTLTDNSNPNELIESKENIEILGGKKFKIRLPWKRGTKRKHANQQTKQCASNGSQHSSGSDRLPASDVVQQSSDATSKVVPPGRRGTRTVVRRSDGNTATVGQQSGSDVSAVGQPSGCSVSNRVRCPFPKLIDWMEHHFPGETYHQALELRRKNFVKIQSSFREVHTFRKLLQLSESVCRLDIRFCSAPTQGTGFVLFDNFILTNAHLFDALMLQNWQMCKVSAQFDYETGTESNSNMFNVKRIVVNEHKDLDYAILEIDLEGQNRKVPPGLLEMFGPMPQDGGACIIGHPAGGVKKIDPTCIIEKEKRGLAIEDHLCQYKVPKFIVHSFIDQGIAEIMIAENVVTYNTFMYGGSSGSPVFDVHGRVLGLHTGGFEYEFANRKESVIEYAQPLLLVFRHLVCKLRKSGNEELLNRVENETKSNPYLSEILESVVGLNENRHLVVKMDTN